MRRTLALTLGFAALVALAMPAAAQEAEAPGDDSLTLEEPDARATRVVPMLCKVAQREQTVGVLCQWRPAEAPAAGYRLGRLELGGRGVVFRTADLARTTFGDLKVRKGLQYAYILQVLGQGGRVIGQSRPQLVLVVPGRHDGPTTTVRRPDASTSTTSTSAPGGVSRVNPSPPDTAGQDGQGQANQVARLRAEIERLQQLQRQRTTTTVARPRPTLPPRPGDSTSTVPPSTVPTSTVPPSTAPTSTAPTSTAPTTTVAARTS